MATVTIKDAQTGETLPGAVVTTSESFETRGQSDEFGTVELAPGNYTARMIGYDAKNFSVTNAPVTVQLKQQEITTGEVIIEGTRKKPNTFWLVLLVIVVLMFRKK